MGIAKIKDDSGKVLTEYHMDDRLKRNLDEQVIKQLHTKDKDCVVVVDGREGAGKSTLAFQIGKYVDPTLDLSRVVFSPDDFRDAVLKAKKGQCIIYDEAFTGFSSRSSLSPINRVLVSLSMQMRQSNLFVLIVLPTIFLLDKYMAMFRTKALVHVFESKGKRGYFKLYNTKKKKFLILMGAKTMSYTHKGLHTNFKGRFYEKFALGDEEVEKKYRKKKKQALADSEKTSMSSAQVKFKEQRDLLIYLVRKQLKLSTRETSNLLNEYDMALSHVQVASICAKFGDNDAKVELKDLNQVGNDEESTEIEEKVEEVVEKPKKWKKKQEIVPDIDEFS